MHTRDIARSIFACGSACTLGVLAACVALASDVFAEDAYVAATLRAFAIGAQSYRWTKNGEPVSGGENGSLEVAWASGGATDIYSVTPVYDVFGEGFVGEPVEASVTNVPLGMRILIR